MKKVDVALVVILVLALLAVRWLAIWATSARGPQSEALDALTSDDVVEVKAGKWLVFRPRKEDPTVGLILYPGAKVDARSYSPAARAIASRGHLVVIVPMPLNLAIFGIDRAAEVVEAFAHIEHWAIGGHSLGGAMAASFAAGNPSKISGLVLWAAYPAESNDLSAADLKVASISGTLDGRAVPEDLDVRRKLLPQDTRWVAIEGGNHAQFGWYGPQEGDNEAAITHETQEDEIVAATVDLLKELEEEKTS